MSNAAYLFKPPLNHLCKNFNCRIISRSFATSTLHSEELTPTLQTITSNPPLDPNLVSTRREERILIRSGVNPIGSRRRRAALQSTSNIPFEHLPYQCFQEALQIIRADREEKLQQIAVERKRIASLRVLDPAEYGGVVTKTRKLLSMERYLHGLKILADINDPVIKKRFEDGQGDMNRPIYRHLADQQWRKYKRLILMQRITQMFIVPDVLPYLDPVAEVRLAFGRRNVQPGEFVDSRVSEIPAKLSIQPFDQGRRLVSIVVLDSDVPNLETDSFEYRCHFLAVNIPVSPQSTSVPLVKLHEGKQVVLPWVAPTAQKGSPYHRISIFVLQQAEGKELDGEKIGKAVKRRGFNLRSFNDKYLVNPVGVTLFRVKWDEGMAGVMKRAGVEGADVELKRKTEKLPYKKKDTARYR